MKKLPEPALETVERAREILEEYGRLLPAAILFFYKSGTIVPLPGVGSHGPKDKDAELAMLKDLCNTTDPDLVVLCNEAWVTTIAVDEARKPKGKPVKLDCIQIWVQDRTTTWNGWAEKCLVNNVTTFKTMCWTVVPEDQAARMHTRLVKFSPEQN